MTLPYVTPSFPGVGGTIKNRPEDFFVQELPLYEPSGDGEHVYCEIQKCGLTTIDAINRLAKALRVSTRDIGYAGLKDACAITRQILSIPGITEEQAMSVAVDDIQVLWAARHGNKLRLGHLAGNRFAIKIRDVRPTDVVRLDPVLKDLARRGMPNYFGEQRFGRRNDNDRLGAAYLRGDDAEVIRLLVGASDPAVDDEASIAARTMFEQGDLAGALNRLPRYLHLEARVLHRFIKTGDAATAVGAADERIRKLWISALQSRLFNNLVARRIDSLGTLLDGDLAWKHDNGSVFAVESAAAEQRRCDAFEISPSGPLLGYRMTMPQGSALAVEQAVLDASGLQASDFRRAGDLRIKGARRPLRVQPADCRLEAGSDEHGGFITVSFALPPGSFATVLLRELMKVDEPDRPATSTREAPTPADQ